MNRLIKWFNLIIIKQKGLKRWQRVVTVLAAMITFATTYALILPAITVEKNGTEDVGGMYLEKTAEQDDLLEENALEPIGVSIAADMDNAVTFAYSDDDMSATAVFSTDEVIPEGTELVVNYVDPESDIYTDLSGRAANLLDREFIYDVTTRSFYDYALVCDNVNVTPKTGLVDIQIIFRNNSVEHVNDVVYAGRFVKPSEQEDGFVELAAGDVNAADELVSVNIDESSAIELTDGIITTLSLKGNDLTQSDSLVGILAGNVDEESKAAAAEIDAEIPDYDGAQGEDTSGSDEGDESDSTEDANDGGIVSALPVKNLTASGNDYNVILTYDETSGIPGGAALVVSEITKDSDEYQTYLNETKKAMGLTEEETLPRYAARFFDIKIMVGEREFIPKSGVSVEITYEEPLAEHPDTDVNAVHFADETAEAEVIEANTTDVQDDGKATVEFTAESFSVYGVIYTVDFHYEINGKTYEFSIPGGGFVSLEHLVEVLRIGANNTSGNNGAEEVQNAADNKEAVKDEQDQKDGAALFDEAIKLNEVEISEAAKKFVADVESVKFSSPELVWVGKVNAAASVGSLKKDNKLEVEYTADLTEDQIAKINAQMIDAGDWALISMQPFTTEETLTVTMKNGNQFVVRVTDAQISTHVITDDGKDYIITVTYGPEAEIPDGAKLTARELVEGTEEYRQYYEETLRALNLTETMEDNAEEGFVQSIVQARFFDITIYAGERKIEPNAPVSVEITYQGQAYSACEEVSVVHFAKSGLENIAPVASVKGNDTVISFEQESFSVTGTVVNRADITNGDYYIIHREGDYWYALASDGSYVDITANYDNASSSVVDYSGTKNISWHVNSTGDNYYIIKANGEDKYITLNGSVVGNSQGAVSIHSGTSESPKNAWITRDVTQNVYFGFDIYPTSYRYHSTALGWRYGFTINNNNLWLQQDLWGRLHYMGGNEASGTNVQFAKLSTNSGELGGNYPNKTYNIDQLDTWLQQAMTDDPIQETSKTASVYDYDNRIYQIDLYTKSGVIGIASDISLAFVTDVSNSMLFPASLTEVSGKTSIKLNSGNLNSLPHNNGEVYFTIADKNSSSTVFALYYDNGWKAMDASYYAKWKGKGVNPDSNHGAVSIGNSDVYLRSDPNSTYYTIYTANEEYIPGLNSHNIYDMTQGNMGNRLYYLEQSIADSVFDLKSIAAKYPLGSIYTALETFAGKEANIAVKDRINYLKIGGYSTNMAQANQTYTNNYNTLYNALSAITTADGTMQNVALSDQTFFGNPAGTGGYVGSNDAQQKYVILVTDGAPNGSGASVDTVVAAAKTLRANGVNVITIGLSIEDVTNADRMLYWAASAMDSNGNIVTNPDTPTNLNTVPSADADKRLFYWAKNGEDLTWIMREIVRTVMREAVVSTTIKDEISEVFYPVSEDGTPLNNGDWIKKDGTKCSSSDPDRAGKITYANGKYSVEWKDQDATWTGWNGKVYVKAREDFLGGNNITTNDYCSFTPTKYTTDKGTSNEKSAPFSAAQQEAKKEEAATPCVNVDELHMTANQTDFTVYLGTQVDPATELRKLWNEIKVIEVVKENGTESGYTIDSKESLYYATDNANKASKDEIYPQSGYDSIALNHYDLDDSIITELLTGIKTSNSVTSDPIDYAPYGQGKVGTITVTLTKSVNSEASGKAPDPHDTEVVSMTSTSPVERYTLTITYTPLPAEGDDETENRKDILVTAGKVSGTDTKYRHNGTAGPGNETDESTSTNIHRIFVFAKSLMVYKKDETFSNSLSGAEFKLYRSATADDPEGSKETLDGLDGKYVLVSILDDLEEIYKEYGIEGGYEGIFASDSLKLLKNGGQYYLVESKAPLGYIPGKPIPITITITNMYAPVPPGNQYSTTIPNTNLYNLEQEAILTMTGVNAHLATASGDDINGTGGTPNHDSDYAYYLISNNPGVALPATGGPGINLIYILGIILTSLAGAGLVLRQKRKTA